MSKFSHVSSHSTSKYFGDNYYSSFKNSRGFGGVFPCILMGTFSSLSLLLLQRVYLKNACVLPQLDCVTSLLQCRAAGKSGERIVFSWIWISYLLLHIDNVYIQNVGNLVGLLHGCSSSSICAANLTSSSTLTLHHFTFSSFFHPFELFHP